jgi:hypothetical protein
MQGVPLLGAVVKDRGANVKLAGAELVGEDDLGDNVNCANHLIKSLVDAVALESQSAHCDRRMAADISFLLSCSAQVRAGSGNMQVFQAAAEPELEHLVPVKDNVTRWEGIYSCLQRALRVKSTWQAMCEDSDALASLIVAAGAESDFPSEDFFQRVTFYVQLFKPLHVLSQRCQAQSKILMPQLIYWIHDVRDSFAPVLLEAADKYRTRAKFLAATEDLLIPLVTGVTVATKAAVLSPENQDIAKRLGVEVFEACWEELEAEVLLFRPLEDDDREMTSACVKFARAMLTKARLVQPARKFEDFWNSKESSFNVLLPIVRLYASMPTSSVKPETVFSYTGRLISKRANRWGVDSVEALAVINDFTRQSDWSFKIVTDAVEKMLDQWAEEKKKRKEDEKTAKREALQAQLDALDAMGESGDSAE